MNILKGIKGDICDKEKDICVCVVCVCVCVCVWCVCVCGVYLYIVLCWTYNQDPLEAFKVSVAIRLFLYKKDHYCHEKISIAMSRMDDRTEWTQRRASRRA